MGFLETDQDYLDAGVEPPEHNPHDASDTVQHDRHIHNWKQIGSHIECHGGQHVHGRPFDHVNQLLIGTSPEGAPIFKTLDIQQEKPDDVAIGASRP